MAESEVHGLDDLSRALKQFPGRVQKNIVTGAARAGASIISKEAKANIRPHDRTGKTRRSISVVKRKSDNPKIIKFTVAPRIKKGGWKAHFLEFGTSKMAAVPFMRPAFENKGPESIVAFRNYMAKRIPKEIEKAER